MNGNYLSYILLGCCFLIFGVLALFSRYRNRKHLASLASMRMGSPNAVRSGSTSNAVKLKCYNFTMAVFIAGSFFWLTALFLVLMVVQTEFRQRPPAFMPVVDALLTGRTAAIVAGLWAAGWIYYAYHRVRLTWVTGPVIDNVPMNVLFYQIRKSGWLFNIIYLRTPEKLWVLVPATSQDTIRFKDVKKMKQENQQNEQYVEQLRANLVGYGAQEKSFRLLSPYFITGVAAWIITLAGILISVT